MDSHKKGFSASRRNGIDHRNRIVRSRTSPNFLAWVQERKLLKKSEEEEIRRKTMGLAEDCTACIFLYLTIDDLQRSSCVCKSWNSIITDQAFIRSHLHHSESGLLCLSSNDTNPRNPRKFVSVESLVLKHKGSLFNTELDAKLDRQTRLHFLEIKDGFSLAELKSFNVSCSGRVLGSCNGLVLLESKVKKGGLVVLNPVTRKVTPLPAGTILRPDKESYGFAFKNSTKEHIAIHLILEDPGYHSCEILTVEKRKWAMVKGPPSGIVIPLNYKPVFANGALYWLCIDNYGSILSLVIEEMVFKLVSLPKSRGAHDEIVEVAGFLCFFAHELDQIAVWVLKGDSNESWMKYYSIRSGFLPDMIPVSGSRFGRWVIFRSYSAYHDEEDGEEDGEEGELEGEEGNVGGRRVEGGEVRSLFIYDFGLGVMKKVRTRNSDVSFKAYMSHVNSLVCS